MDFLSYVRALRRRWLLIVACVVLGAVIGYATTLLKSDEVVTKKGRTYYRADSTVVVDFSNADGGLAPAYSNLDQVALVVTTGAVPDAVADELGTAETGRELGERVVTTTDSLTNTLEIAVVDADRDRAVELADTFAAKLDEQLQLTDQQRYDTAVADLKAKVDFWQGEKDKLFNQLVATPADSPQRSTLQQQYIATENTYQSRYSQLTNTSAAGPAQTSVTVLEEAEAEPISADEYAARLKLGATGQNHIRLSTSGEPAAPIATSTSSSAFNSEVGRAFAGGFLGLLIGVGLVLLLDRLDRRMRTREEVEQAFQLPVLAEVPRLSRKDQTEDSLVAYTAPLSRVAEAFRAVRTSLVFQQSMLAEPAPASNGLGTGNGNGHAASGAQDAEPMVVMVTSAAPREGKSTTSANLAVAFAEGGSSVLVVNCDFRRPTIHRRFGVFDEPRRVQDTKVPGVKIVTNVLADAAANPSQVVAAQRQVISAARGRFDVIILDTAPMLTANDAVGIVSSVDFVVLVAQLDMTTNDNARRVMELLSRVHASVSGVVLIGAADASNEYYYYYQRERVAAKGDASKGDASKERAAPTSATLDEAGLDAASDPEASVTFNPEKGATSDAVAPSPVETAPRDIFGEPSGTA